MQRICRKRTLHLLLSSFIEYTVTELSILTLI